MFAAITDQYALEELIKRQDRRSFTRKRFTLQNLAARGHRKTPEQIGDLAEKVGRGRILVCHGGGNQIGEVRLANSLVLQMNAGVAEDGESVRLVAFEGSGHVLAMEQCREVKKETQRFVGRTNTY